MSNPEPWLRGPVPDVHPLLAPLLYSFQQVREDLASHTAGLTARQLWVQPHGMPSLGFHLRHIAGSVERLTAYLEGKDLNEDQLEAIYAESYPGGTLEELLEGVERALRDSERAVRAIDPNALAEPRFVGRLRLPSTVIGLVTHIAEHTQRHLGAAIATARAARAVSPGEETQV